MTTSNPQPLDAATQGAAAPGVAPAAPQQAAAERANAAFLRAENEDDDGYDPYSDRPATPEPLFERDPWA